MAQKYYNTEEAAKKFDISVEEVKKMLEQRELHGYRDGADWKFKVEDIDRMAQERKASSLSPIEEEGTGDVLLSEVALGQPVGLGTSGTVIAMDALAHDAATSDIQLASDLNIVKPGEELPTPKAGKIETSGSNTARLDELELAPAEDDLTLADSSAMLPNKSDVVAGVSGSAIDLGGSGALEDDDLVLGGSGTGSDVTIGGDSGISLLDAAADSGISLEQPLDLSTADDVAMELDEGDMLSVSEVDEAPLKTDDDFLLTPLEEAADADESESGSQVIALDAETDEAGMIGAGAAGSMAGLLDEDLSAQPALDLGMAAPLAASPLLAGHAVGLPEGAGAVQPSAVFFEPPYTNLQIAGLITCAVLLMLCGMMTYDLLRNMWSWQGAYPVNSTLMDLILGLF
jgi:excisionase family DNA binding protein